MTPGTKMGFWQRATLVLRASATLRKRQAAPADAGEVIVSGEQLQALQDIAERMAGMSATIKQLEEQARDLEAEAEATGAHTDAVPSRDGDVAARAQVQIEVIDEMLGGIRALRAAIDQQRDELTHAEQQMLAEQQLLEGGAASHEGDPQPR